MAIFSDSSHIDGLSGGLESNPLPTGRISTLTFYSQRPLGKFCMFTSPLKDGLIVLVILLLFFGPKRLPALSRAIGESVKEFKGGIAQVTGSDSDEDKSEITSTHAQAQPNSSSEQHTNA
jgi:TatA/E family protein of Tat protein translocase